MRLHQKTAILTTCLLLAGCGLFSKDRLQIDGEKILVLSEPKVIAADYMKGDIKIQLSPVYKNSFWNQNGGNSLHNMGNLKAGEVLIEAWNQDFGKGNSKRDYLIATPVVAHNKIFTIDTQAVVSAFQQVDGKLVWERKIKPKLKEDKEISLKGAGLAYGDGMIFVATGFGDVYALDEKDGKTKWKYSAKTPIRISPTVGNKALFVQTMDNTLYALNIQNGEEIWRYAVPSQETTLVGGASPVYSEKMDVLVAGFSNGELRALKASTGSPLWGDYLISSNRTNSLDSINTIVAAPIIDGNVLFAAGNKDTLVAIDLRSGQRIWERQITIQGQPWISGKFLFVLTQEAHLLAMQTESGKIVWDCKLDKEKDEVKIFGPILINNRLLVSASDGKKLFVSPYSGEILGQMTDDNESFLTPVVANNQVIITSTDAEIIVYQ